MKYELVSYQPGFRDRVLELQTQLWSPDVALNAAYLAWKYDQNPYLKSPLIRLAVRGKQVVGMMGMYGAAWQVGQPSSGFFGPCAGDLVVAPGHRNRGLAAEIIERTTEDLAESGYEYAFATSASSASQRLFGSLGWRSVGPFEVARWRLPPSTFRTRVRACVRRLPLLARSARGVKRLVSGLASPRSTVGRNPFGALDRNGARARGRTSGQVSLEQTPRPAAMARLVERLGSDGRIRQVRDEAYFAWRFRNPLSRYRFLFSSDARLQGYLVLQTALHGADVGVYIVDWEAAEAQVRDDLLRAAIGWGRFAELTIWPATLPADAKILIGEAGFTVSPTDSHGRVEGPEAFRPTILVKRLPNRPSEAADWVIERRRPAALDDWDLRMIYSDAF